MTLGRLGIMYRRIYAIPDIHGRKDLLDQALELMSQDGYEASQDMLIFLGDYIDRGPDSKGVVDTIKGLVESGAAQAVIGNHESFAIDYYLKGGDLYLWVVNGGEATRKSYASGQMSDEHIKWLASLPRSLEMQGFFFSHAPVPRQIHRHGRSGFNNVSKVGEHYTLDELTWTYFSQYEERAGGMMDFHEGPKSDSGKGEENLIGICGHIHRGERITEARMFPKYRMLDTGAGCFPTGRLAIHECISNRTFYADTNEYSTSLIICYCGENTEPSFLHNTACSAYRSV